MKNNEIILSKKKTICFGIIISLLMSAIISYGSFDIIAAFYGEVMPVERMRFFTAMFPGVLVILVALLVSFVLLSAVYKKKENKAKK